MACSQNSSATIKGGRFDDMSEEEGDDVHIRSDDDDGDDDEEEHFSDMDGFIVHDLDDDLEGDEEKQEPRSNKKKRRKKETKGNYELDEDDYELIENAGFYRPKPGKKKYKRLKKADEEEVNNMDGSDCTAEEKLKSNLFGENEEDNLPEDVEEDVPEEDDMADFIVDERHNPKSEKRPKKSFSWRALGVSSHALQEARDIFGNVDELLFLRNQRLGKDGNIDDLGDGRKKFVDEFEHSVCRENYLSQGDIQIRARDVAERIQLFEEMVGHPLVDDENLQAESTWILNQLNSSNLSHMVESVAIGRISREDIFNVLKMVHVQKLEIPFIAMYRKELCLSLLKDPNHEGDVPEVNKPQLKWHKMLWAVHNLDKKWLLLQKRKSSLQLSFKKRAYFKASCHPSEEILLEPFVNMLGDADSERAVDDIDLKFNLFFPPDGVVEEGKFKRPNRTSHYEYNICRKAGLAGAASMFGLSPEKFGQRLQLKEMGEEVVDPKETPEEMALGFQSKEFETPQAVLKGARHMAAVGISSEPSVRKHVRDFYVDHVLVSTKPTDEGNATIDYFHHLSAAKWLRDKPASEFRDAQWLLIQKAEEKKLLQVTFRPPDVGKLEQQFYENYLSDGVSRRAQLWNEQRKLIIEEALFKILLPSFEEEARFLLTVRAKSWLLSDYGNQLWRKVSVAPYKHNDNEALHDRDDNAGSQEEGAPRVMACCGGPGKPPTTFVMLDSSGEVLDVLHAGFLGVRSQKPTCQQRKKIDQERVVKFMTDHKPQVVLGAVNLSCPRLKDDIFEMIFRIIEHHPCNVGHEVDELTVVYGDESLPRVYENSHVSSYQLPKQHGIVRRAVALGRYLQNPLAMVATLCGPGREILSWKIHPLENYLAPDEKYEMIEQVMVDVTNQVGIDLNLAACHDWLFAPLQFIAGLGPRKALSLKCAVIRAGQIFSRREILTNLGVLERNVFVNAAGFLRVQGSGRDSFGNHAFDLLDDTRIHPESYQLAQKMAKDVFAEYMDQEIDDLDEESQEMVIDHVRNNPNLLKALDIDAYSKSIQAHLRTSTRETLSDIKVELLHGFLDWRTPYAELTQDEEFYMICGETKDDLAEGMAVQATVCKVQGERIYCELESGLTGVISKEDFSHERDFELTKKLTEGSILPCKIKFIRKDRYQVILTCKENDLRNDCFQRLQQRDPYYAEDERALQIEVGKAHRNKDHAKKSFTPRMIVHPRFQNITLDEAILFLADKEVGESIIRPSSKGPLFLTLTLKVHDGLFAHKHIAEGDKCVKDMMSLLGLGKTLRIGEDTFEDLDEVMDRYVDPFVSNLREMLGYRKFKPGSKAEIDNILRMEKSEFPSRIVYCFGVSHEHPGAFILSYIRSTNPHHEYVGLYPKGFKFRSKMFKSLDRLVTYFQKHIDDLPKSSVPLIGSVAPMVPLTGPVSGCGSIASEWGGCGDAGWRSRGHIFNACMTNRKLMITKHDEDM